MRLSGPSRMNIVFTTLVLGYLLALPFAVSFVARSISDQGHTFALRMSSTTSGALQVFYDVGSGYSEHTATTQALIVSNTGFEYRLPMPPATYQGIRIDPGVGAGTYTIEQAAVLDRDGSTLLTIPLAELQVVQQLTLLERTPNRLVLSAPADSNDPMLLWRPSSPFTLMLGTRQMLRLLIWVIFIWLGGIAAAWIVRRVLRMVWTGRDRLLPWISGFGAANPALAIVIAALLATVVASYPLLFAGRSLASPANGGMVMLYDRVPFLPGSDDFETEDVNGRDVGPMMWQSLAHSRVERQALAMGEIPLWNRYTALGRPLWGQGLSMILDPLQWLTLVGSEPAPGWDLKFVAHRFVFGVGVGLAALAATGAWQAASVAAVSAPFAGAFAYRFNHPAVFSLTYAPWALFGWFLMAKATSGRARARAALILAVSSCLLLVASTPKEAVIALLGMSATGALAVLLSTGSWRLRGRRLATAGVAGVVVVLLTAPHWVVFLDTLRASANAYEKPQVILGGLSHAVALWVGALMPGPPQPGLHLFALVLVFAAITAPLRMWEDRSSLASAISAALLIALALGAVPGSWLIAIPLVGQIGHMYNVLLMAALTPLLIVCATGARALWNAGASATIVATIATGAAAWWVLIRVGQLGPLNRFEPWAVALLLPLAVGWPVCLLSARRRSVAAAAAAAGAMMTLILPGGLQLESGVSEIDRIVLQPRPRPRLAQSSPAIDAIHATTTAPVRTSGVGYTLYAGTQMLYGLEDLRGADPLEVPAYRELVDASGMQRHGYWLTVLALPDIPRLDPILDMLNVGFLVVPGDSVPRGATALPMKEPDLIRAIQRSTPWPRAFFIGGTGTYTTPADLVQQVTARRVPFAAVLESDARAVEATNGLPHADARAVPADRYILTPNTTTFRVRADTEGIAVLGETYLPDDFIATLNGKSVPYFRVNHVFKAIRIPGPGEWEVRFEYRPQHWRIALGAAAVGVLIMVAFASVSLRNRTVVTGESQNAMSA